MSRGRAASEQRGARRRPPCLRNRGTQLGQCGMAGRADSAPGRAFWFTTTPGPDIRTVDLRLSAPTSLSPRGPIKMPIMGLPGRRREDAQACWRRLGRRSAPGRAPHASRSGIGLRDSGDRHGQPPLRCTGRTASGSSCGTRSSFRLRVPQKRAPHVLRPPRRGPHPGSLSYSSPTDPQPVPPAVPGRPSPAEPRSSFVFRDESRETSKAALIAESNGTFPLPTSVALRRQGCHHHLPSHGSAPCPTGVCVNRVTAGARRRPHGRTTVAAGCPHHCQRRHAVHSGRKP